MIGVDKNEAYNSRFELHLHALSLESLIIGYTQQGPKIGMHDNVIVCFRQYFSAALLTYGGT